MEIEKKFRIKKMPENLEQYEQKKMEQGYLCDDPVLRIRKSNDSYILTYKAKPNQGNINSNVKTMEEIEVKLSEAAYLHLKEKTDGYMIEKTRYCIPLQHGLIAELDVFEGILKDLVFVEVEFKTQHEAASFVPPSWFGDDVTCDARYENRNLAKVDSFAQMQYNDMRKEPLID